MNDTRFEIGRKFILRNKLDYLIEKESIFENWSRYTEEEELKNNLMHVSIEGYLLPFLFSFFSQLQKIALNISATKGIIKYRKIVTL